MCTIYRYYSTCEQKTSLQYRVWPFVIIRLDTVAFKGGDAWRGFDRGSAWHKPDSVPL